LKKQLLQYIREVPILGYNSAKYDIKLIKSSLFDVIMRIQGSTTPMMEPTAEELATRHPATDTMECEPDDFNVKNIGVIKQAGGYSSISIRGIMVFKDMYKFCSPNTTLEKFMSSYNKTGDSEGKGVFPYEWLTSVDKLDDDHLPEIQHWFSTLKNENKLGDTEAKQSAKLAELQVIWQSEGMTTMKDFLRWYNRLDVIPFCSAIKVWLKTYHKWTEGYEDEDQNYEYEYYSIPDPENGVDILKDCIGVPGSAKKMMQNYVCRAEGYQGIYLFGDRERDLYNAVINNITGGPSIVFNRLVDTAEPGCPYKSIMGHDANNLYPGTLLQPMPSGPVTAYRPAKDTKADDPNPKFVRTMAYNTESQIAMRYLSDPENGLEDYKHVYNCGQEAHVGPYRVDAINDITRDIIEICGCWHHGHDCDPKFCSSKEQKNKQYRHQKRNAFIKAILPGYTITERYTCHPDFKQYRSSNNFNIGSKCSNKWGKGESNPVRQSEVLDAVKAGTFCGFVKVVSITVYSSLLLYITLIWI
jgi:hypothetical protein